MKVMIVDDSILLQERLLNALRKVDKNIIITQAGSCKEALELYSCSPPETVILDISLPDGSGINLLEQFKKLNLAVYVIILTNYPTNEFRMRCMTLGADQFIDKSNISELLNAIN